MGEQEDRLGKLESQLQGLKLTTSGMSDIVAKYPAIPKDTDKLSVHERLSALEKAHDNFRIVGGSNVQVSGSLKNGFCINNSCPGEDQGTGFPGFLPPPAPGCVCPRDVTELNTITVSGSFHGVSTPETFGFCCGSVFENTGSVTEVWTRIPYLDSFTGGGAQEFKLWFDESCNLNIEINGGDNPIPIPSDVEACEADNRNGSIAWSITVNNGGGFWTGDGSSSSDGCRFQTCNVNFGTGSVPFTCNEVPGFTASGTFTCECEPDSDCGLTVSGSITVS